MRKNGNLNKEQELPKDEAAARDRSASMAARRKPSSIPTKPPQISEPNEASKPKASSSDDPPLRPPKLGLILPASAVFFIPYFGFLYFYYDVEPSLRRSIAINAAMSFAGFIVVVRMIPLAAKYVLRRSLFGYDINKKDTPQGSIKV